MSGRRYSRIFVCKEVGTGHWSFIGPCSEKKWYSIKEDSPQGIWDNIAEKMLLELAESGCPIFRATTPLSRGQLKRKGHGKLSIHFAADQETIGTIFRIIVSVNQLSLYGAVAETCEEHESLHERTGRPDMVGQSIVISAIKTEVPLENDDPAYQNFLLQQYGERIEKLSQQDKLSKFCMDAGFLSVVENGQYFMTKDIGDLTQFNTVACREYTLPREDEASQPKGWIQGNTKNLVSLCIRNFEESNSSSSSFPASTSRRGWSGSFLENRRKSSEQIPTVYSLVYVWNAHRDHLLRFSSASLAFLALRVMPYEAVPLHT